MPLTPSEKCRRYREKQKAITGANAVRAQDAKRKKEEYHKDEEASREKKKLYMRKKRAEEKMSRDTPSPSSSSYKAASSLTRAIKRTENYLPRSPRKRSAVVNSLFDKSNVKETDLEESKARTAHNKVSSELQKKVVKYFLRSDIAYHTPGRREYITIVDKHGKKVSQNNWVFGDIDQIKL